MYSIILTKDGKVLCFGNNDRGNLGTGNDIDSLIPILITTDSLSQDEINTYDYNNLTQITKS